MSERAQFLSGCVILFLPMLFVIVRDFINGK
jgi:hypothetical protein